MTEINPMLKPEKGVRPEGGTPRDGMNIPVAGVAGFWRRLGAFLLDLLAIYALTRVVGSVFREPLLAVGEPLAAIFFLHFLAYFILADSALLGGRTLGKLLAGIKTIQYDGRPPSILKSALRYSLLLGPLFAINIVIPLLSDPTSYKGYMLPKAIFGGLAVAFFVATTFAISFNPFKQGLHDYVAKTLVVPASSGTTFEGVTERVGLGWQRYQKHSQIMGFVTFLLIGGYISFYTLRSPSDYDAWVHDTRVSILEEAGVDQYTFQERVTALSFDPANPNNPELSADIEELRLAFRDPESTAPLKMLFEVYSPGKLPDDPRVLKESGEILANRYHEKIVGEWTNPTIELTEEQQTRALGNIENRPIVYQVAFYEAVQMMVPIPKLIAAWEFPLPPRSEFEPIERR